MPLLWFFFCLPSLLPGQAANKVHVFRDGIKAAMCVRIEHLPLNGLPVSSSLEGWPGQFPLLQCLSSQSEEESEPQFIQAEKVPAVPFLSGEEGREREMPVKASHFPQVGRVACLSPWACMMVSQATKER